MKDSLAKEEGHFKVKFDVSISHLDWQSLKETENEETFGRYKSGLGLFVALTNKSSGVTGIYRIDHASMSDEGKLSSTIELTVGMSGQHSFSAMLCDNYG